MRQPFDPQIALARFLELYGQLIGDRADMPIRAPGGDNHPVRQSGLAVEINGDDVFRLGVFKLGKNGFQEGGLFCTRRRNRGFRGAFRRSALLRLYCQSICPLVTGRSSLRLLLSLSGSEQRQNRDSRRNLQGLLRLAETRQSETCKREGNDGIPAGQRQACDA